MDVFAFFVFLAATACAAATGALFPPGAWYRALRKPAWTPPNWVFPLVWTTLYLLMAFAGARVVARIGADPGAGALALAFWAGQIAANTLWTPIFFGLRRLRAALPVMGMLWVMVAGALWSHWQVDPIAGLCFAPYLLWVTLAGALNLSVARLNPEVVPLDPQRV